MCLNCQVSLISSRLIQFQAQGARQRQSLLFCNWCLNIYGGTGCPSNIWWYLAVKNLHLFVTYTNFSYLYFLKDIVQLLIWHFHCIRYYEQPREDSKYMRGSAQVIRGSHTLKNLRIVVYWNQSPTVTEKRLHVKGREGMTFLVALKCPLSRDVLRVTEVSARVAKDAVSLSVL